MTAYDELKSRRVRPRNLDPEIAKERAREKTRRYQEATRRAAAVLASRHAEEYKALLDEERAALNQERGPLPGDPT